MDLSALRSNADVIRARVGPGCGIMAVVKADAYGHGAVVVARSLERRVWGFGVSLVEEGVEIRRAGVDAPIVVLGAFYGHDHRDLIAYRLTPVIGDAADLARFRRAADDLGVERVDVHLKIDTGMSRLGILPGAALEAFCDVLATVPGISLSGLMTHFHSADDGDSEPSLQQLARFEDARAQLASRGHVPQLVHAANSAAMVRFPQARFGLVRPGLALYGLQPGPDANIPGLRPVMALKSRIVALREIAVGESVSYGAQFRAVRRTRVATVAVGYADGYTRRLSGRAEVLVRGRRVPLIGAVTMDMCLVDVTDLDAAGLGDEVVLLGSQGEHRISADELAQHTGTVSYEVLCAVSKRVPRVYTGERP